MLLGFLLVAFCFSGLDISLVWQFFICEVGGIVGSSCGIGLSWRDFFVFVLEFHVLAAGLVVGSCSVSNGFTG